MERKWRQQLNIFTRLDVLMSKVYVAKKYNFSQPTIDMSREKAFFEAKDLRHPLIEAFANTGNICA